MWKKLMEPILHTISLIEGRGDIRDLIDISCLIKDNPSLKMTVCDSNKVKKVGTIPVSKGTPMHLNPLHRILNPYSLHKQTYVNTNIKGVYVPKQLHYTY